MKKVIVIGVALLMAAAACGEVADDDAPTNAEVEADAQEESANGGTAEPSDDPETNAPSEDQSSGPDADDSGSTDPSPTTIPEERTAEDEDLPERVPPTSETPVTGEVDSNLVANIKQDLISRTGATESDITVIRSEEVIWNDGSLGCPEPGEMYTQALVNGFWVVLEHGGTEYDYRANDRGFFRLCEGFGAPPSNPTG